ncbi:MAG: hypothetical protein AVDCRST_MAG25-1594 [uncultured Rubrobacteraceae bacterium]|uniref:Uncharacterized protein n=1 Tax=uncultured Rubrobacteraceae bacterium TaxID=349277 RepID=A0A6J4R9D0_9ACTN|nr:MAG: hypothetical protein AVDCRST_MAG25-1594 [uncultured Rubrobacteraceae bacterium]
MENRSSARRTFLEAEEDREGKNVDDGDEDEQALRAFVQSLVGARSPSLARRGLACRMTGR